MEAALRKVVDCGSVSWVAASFVGHVTQLAECLSFTLGPRATASTFLWPTVGIPAPIISEPAEFDSRVGPADFLIKKLSTVRSPSLEHLPSHSLRIARALLCTLDTH